jgi:hypothetical protein
MKRILILFILITIPSCTSNKGIVKETIRTDTIRIYDRNKLYNDLFLSKQNDTILKLDTIIKKDTIKVRINTNTLKLDTLYLQSPADTTKSSVIKSSVIKEIPQTVFWTFEKGIITGIILILVFAYLINKFLMRK